jgi:hypothetical protein
MLPITTAQMGLLFGAFRCTVCPIEAALWKHKHCDYSFNNEWNFTKFFCMLIWWGYTIYHTIFFIQTICTAPHPKSYFAHPWIHTHTGAYLTFAVHIVYCAPFCAGIQSCIAPIQFPPYAISWFTRRGYKDRCQLFCYTEYNIYTVPRDFEKFTRRDFSPATQELGWHDFKIPQKIMRCRHNLFDLDLFTSFHGPHNNFICYFLIVDPCRPHPSVSAGCVTWGLGSNPVITGCGSGSERVEHACKDVFVATDQCIEQWYYALISFVCIHVSTYLTMPFFREGSKRNHKHRI